MKTAEKIKLIQQIASLTQEKLAQKLGVSFVTLNSWVNERSVPRKTAAEKIDLLYKNTPGKRLSSQEYLMQRRP